MAWNYRDYGRSGGMPDPFTTMHDSESILKFLIEDLGLKGKIGCYGRSLGGTMATHIANHYPQYIKFLFVDRSLGNLEIMAQRIVNGKCNLRLFDCFSQGWSVISDKNYFEAKCFKMVSQDPNDEIVDQYCALNTHAAKRACEEYIGETRYSSLKILKTFSAIRMLINVETKLFILLKQ